MTQKEFRVMLKLMYEVRQYNLKELKSQQVYTDFIYNIACNVPFSSNEEGQINKKINRTETKQMQTKAEKGYFYLENLLFEEEDSSGSYSQQMYTQDRTHLYRFQRFSNVQREAATAAIARKRH